MDILLDSQRVVLFTCREVRAGNGGWHINGTKRNEIGTGLLFSRKYQCAKLGMFKIAPKTK